MLSSDGDPIQLDPALPFRFIAGGVVEQAGAANRAGACPAQERLGFAKSRRKLFHRRPRRPRPAPAEDRIVRSGYLEMSGVNPVEEMVELITASRAYEANVRIIQQHDTATSELISRMLKV